MTIKTIESSATTIVPSEFDESVKTFFKEAGTKAIGGNNKVIALFDKSAAKVVYIMTYRVTNKKLTIIQYANAPGVFVNGAIKKITNYLVDKGTIDP